MNQSPCFLFFLAIEGFLLTPTHQNSPSESPLERAAIELNELCFLPHSRTCFLGLKFINLGMANSAVNG